MKIVFVSETKELEVKAKGLQAQATALEVVDKASYNVANAMSAAAKLILTAMDESYDPVIKAAHEAHKAAVKAKKDQYSPVEAAMQTINAKMTAWYRFEQAKADMARKALDALNRKVADDAAIAQAEMLASMGMADAAEDVLNTPPVIESATVAELEKADGVYYRDSYSAECFDLLELAKAVVAGTMPINSIEANMTVLNGLARALKGSQTIPGVRIIKTTTQGRR